MFGEESDDGRFRGPRGVPDVEEASSDVVATVLGSLTGTFAGFSLAFLVILGFAGGTVPVVGFDLPGGFAHGLAWMAAVGTAGLVVLWVVPLLISVVLYRAVSRLLTPAPLPSSRPAVRPQPRTRAA